MSQPGWGDPAPPPGGYGPQHSPPPQPGYGGGYGAPPNHSAPQTSWLGWISIALGISSWLLGTSLMTSIPGLIVAKVELANIKAGKMDASQAGICKVGFWLNVANVVFTLLMIVLTLLFFVLFFGFALFTH